MSTQPMMQRRLAIVTESPLADWEHPVLERLLGHAGISLGACHLLHLLPTYHPSPERCKWVEVEGRLAALTEDLTACQPHMVLLLDRSGHLLRAFSGERGWSTDDRAGYVWTAAAIVPGVKCMAIHSMSRLRQEWCLTGEMRHQLARVARELRTDGVEVPERTITVMAPWHGWSATMVVDRLQLLRDLKLPLAHDIEGGTNMGPACYGFARSAHHGDVVPIYDTDGVSVWSEEDEVLIMGAVQALLGDPLVPKIIQNYAYEAFVEAWCLGIAIRGLADDTMVKGFELNPELEKSLEFLAMLYTAQPWWKLEHREVEGRYVPFMGARRATTEEWFIYNGTDCCVTFEVNEAMEARLTPAQRVHYRWNVQLLVPLAYMSLRGLRYNPEEAKRRLVETQARIYELQDEINQEAASGRPELKAFLEALESGLQAPLIPLLTSAFCCARRTIKAQVTTTTWQPHKWNGKKWVKAGKRINQETAYGLCGVHLGYQADHPNKEQGWLKPIHTTRECNVPAPVETLEDVRRFAKDSCFAECERALALSNNICSSEVAPTPAQRGELSTLLGLAVNINSTSQGGDAQWYVFEHCGAPKQFKKEGGKNTTKLTTGNEAVLAAFIATEDARLATFMAWRGVDTRREALQASTDPDGRVRCGYTLPGTDTYRLSCSKSPTGSGYNLQTVTDDLRDLFPADEGCEMGQVDLRGADGYTLAVECARLGDRTMLDDLLADIKPVNIIVLLYTEGVHINDLPREELKVAQKRVNKERWEYAATKPIFYGYCMTGDHELLTEEGWKQIDRIGCGDKVASYGLHTRSIHFEHPICMTRLSYTGNLYTFKGHSIDATVTADHRMPYTTNGNAKCLTAAEMFRRRSGQLPTAGSFFNHGGAYTANYGRLIAAIQSDGCYQKNGFLTFCFVKQRKVDRIQVLLEANSVAFKVRKYGSRTHISVYDKPAISRFKPYGKVAGPKMLAWSKEAMDGYLAEYAFWDGHTEGPTRQLFSVNKEHLGWIDTFAHLNMMNGCYGGSFTSGFMSTVHKMSLNNRTFADMSTLFEKTVREVENEPVYCPTVNTGYVMARRNGKIFVTGNCYLMGPRKMAAGIAEDSYKETGVPMVVTPKRCEEIMRMIDVRYPGLRRWQHAAGQVMMREGVLRTSVGWQRQFHGRKETVGKRGVPDRTTHGAWLGTLPQFNTTYATKMGLWRLWTDPDNRREDGSLRVEPLHTVHDSLNPQWKVEDREFARSKLLPVWFHNVFPLVPGMEMSIPASATYGPNWKVQTPL